MPKLLIIADDFTGSLDTGVQFAKRGINTLVTVLRAGTADLAADCQVLVVNTESRHLSPTEAYQTIAALVTKARTAGFDCFYKKTDSTLRGNIGSEMAALLESAPGDELIFVPAFPKLKRFTIQGQQYVGELLLSESSFANDPFNPTHQSDVRAIIGEQTNLIVENIYSDQYDRLLNANNRLLNSNEKGKTIRVVDAKTDEDLRQIGQILKSTGKSTLLAGCSGFAELLPDLLGFKSSMTVMPYPHGKMLLVSGSVNPMALKQVQYAFVHCGYSDSQLSTAQKIDAAHIDHEWEQKLAGLLAQKGKAAIWSKRSENTADDAYARAETLGIPPESLASLIANNIGAIVKRMLDREPIGTLIIFGGDTMLGIADQIDCHLVRPLDEIIPGVVLAQFVDQRFHMNVVTKAGGFGDEDVVERIEEYFSKK
jgi:uncharacterized protein YgbK (DUF1537 family)